MELAYLYIEEYRNLKKVGLNFSNDVHIDYDAETKVLKVEKKDNPLPDKFWGENISNLSVIVGNNSVGKTNIMQYIISVWEAMMDREEKNPKGIIVIRDTEHLYYCALGKENFEINVESTVSHNLRKVEFEELRKIVCEVKILYLTNVFSFSDYERNRKSTREFDRFMPVFDCSMGALLYWDFVSDSNKEMRAVHAGISEIQTYYFYEIYKQVKFVFDRSQHSILEKLHKKNCRIPVPKTLYMNMFLDNQFELLLSGWESERLREKKWDDGLDEIFFPKESKKIKESNGFIEENAGLKYQFCRCCFCAMVRNVVRMLQEYDVKSGIFFEILYESKMEDCEDEKNEFINAVEYVWKIVWEKFVPHIDVKEQKNILEQIENLKVNCLNFMEYIENETPNLSEHVKVENGSTESLKRNSGTVRLKVSTEDDEWFMMFLRRYRYTAEPEYYLDFDWGLSSGETNLLSTFARLYYVFPKDLNEEDTIIIKNTWPGREICNCKKIIIMGDEIDLAFHPEWQREYIDLLTMFLRELYPPAIFNNIQIILSTHSPIMLSDIPQQNVIYLEKDDENNVKVDDSGRKTTFGQNIHLLYRDNFFLKNGTMGRFAHEKIQKCYKKLSEIEKMIDDQAEILNNIKKLRKQSAVAKWMKIDGEHLGKLKSGTFRMLFKDPDKELEEQKKIVSIIAEPIIKKRLERKIAEIEQKIERRVGGEYGTEQRKVADFSDEQIEKWLKLLKEEKEKRGYDKNSNV